MATKSFRLPRFRSRFLPHRAGPVAGGLCNRRDVGPTVRPWRAPDHSTAIGNATCDQSPCLAEAAAGGGTQTLHMAWLLNGLVQSFGRIPHIAVGRGQKGSHFRGEREPAQWLRNGARNRARRERHGSRQRRDRSAREQSQGCGDEQPSLRERVVIVTFLLSA